MLSEISKCIVLFALFFVLQGLAALVFYFFKFKRKTYTRGEKMCKFNAQGFGVEFVCDAEKCFENEGSTFTDGITQAQGGTCPNRLQNGRLSCDNAR